MRKTPAPEGGPIKQGLLRAAFEKPSVLIAIVLVVGTAAVAGIVRAEFLNEQRSDVDYLLQQAKIQRDIAQNYKKIKCRSEDNDRVLTLAIREENITVNEYTDQIEDIDDAGIPVVDEVLSRGNTPGMGQLSSQDAREAGITTGPINPSC